MATRTKINPSIHGWHRGFRRGMSKCPMYRYDDLKDSIKRATNWSDSQFNHFRFGHTICKDPDHIVAIEKVFAEYNIKGVIWDE